MSPGNTASAAGQERTGRGLEVFESKGKQVFGLADVLAVFEGACGGGDGRDESEDDDKRA